MTLFSNLFLEMWSQQLHPQPTLAVTAGRDMEESQSPQQDAGWGFSGSLQTTGPGLVSGCGGEKRAGALCSSELPLAEADSDLNTDLPSIHLMSINHARLVKIILNTKGSVGQAGPSPSPWGWAAGGSPGLGAEQAAAPLLLPWLGAGIHIFRRGSSLSEG